MLLQGEFPQPVNRGCLSILFCSIPAKTSGKFDCLQLLYQVSQLKDGIEPFSDSAVRHPGRQVVGRALPMPGAAVRLFP